MIVKTEAVNDLMHSHTRVIVIFQHGCGHIDIRSNGKKSYIDMRSNDKQDVTCSQLSVTGH